jgi:hypothetical protein
MSTESSKYTTFIRPCVSTGGTLSVVKNSSHCTLFIPQ